MLTRTSTSVAIPAALLTVALAATGCGLLETNDDELETLRVEIIQLREDFLEIEAEVSLMARRVVTTTTTPAPATTTAAPTAVTTTAAPGDAADDAVTTPTVPVGLDENTILTATYQWGPSDPAIILQELLGIQADGWYGNGTRGAHLAELEARDLDTSGVPSPPTTTTEVAADDATDDGADDATTTTEATEATTTTTEATTTTTTGG
ncbi:MAG: hypothetical protein QF881_06490 [Acidimicrobiales bacterium]|jgi:hypothetical protein|nr:hypothetical protein [Acidimicrobiales bacterium]